MIEKKLINKIMKSITRREIGLKDHQIMHPLREWFLGLAIASLFLSIAVFLCVKLYGHYNSLEPGSSSNNEAPIVIYKAEEIETALAEFSERKKTHERIKATLASNIELSQEEIPITTSTVLPTPSPKEQPNETNNEVLDEVPTPVLGGQ